MMLKQDISSNTMESITITQQVTKREVGVSIDNSLLIDFYQDRNVILIGNVFQENVEKFVLGLTKEVTVVLMKNVFQVLSANLEFVRS